MTPEVEAILRLFYPQFFDPQSPQYVDPDILEQLAVLSQETRPWCLSPGQQDFAQAAFIAYLVSLRGETSSGNVSSTPVAGPIVSEKEGDIQVSYAAPSSGATNTGMSNRPPSDPWDTWNRFWIRCGKGAILTRFGDPVAQEYMTAQTLTNYLVPQAVRILA